MLLSEAITALLLATKADGRSPATVDGYRRKLRPLRDFLGDVQLETVTTDALRRYVVTLQDQNTLWQDHPKLEARAGGLSPFTIAGYIRAFKRLFNFLESEGLLDHNPARRIRQPVPKVMMPKAVSIDDFLALLKTTEGGGLADIRDRAVILFLADSGCRVAGLCGLRVADVDITRGVAIVTEKGEKSRPVMFTETTAAAIAAWLEVRPADKGAALFLSLGPKCDGGLSTGAVVQMLKRRAELAGVAGRVNPHAFRHAFAREFLFNGGDLASLSDLMGHSSIEVTKMFYAIFTFEELRKRHRQFSPVAHLLEGSYHVPVSLN